MAWSPPNNQYDGVNAMPVNDVELNAPFYIWDFIYTVLVPVVLYAPLLTGEPGGGDPGDPGYEEAQANRMRLMMVPPERGRGTC